MKPQVLKVPDPLCPKCEGSGHCVYPPLEVQEQEAKDGKQKWVTRIPCDCYITNEEAIQRAAEKGFRS